MSIFRNYKFLQIKMASSNNLSTETRDVLPTSPISSLLSEVCTNTTHSNWIFKLPSCNKIQQIKQQGINFNTCAGLVHPNDVWELDEDQFLIRLDNQYPNVYVTKCTVQQAIHLNTSQIPFIPYSVFSLSDIENETLRINSMFSKFPDVTPFIFELQIDHTGTNTSSKRVSDSNKRITNIFLQHAPLIPKSTCKELVNYLKNLYEQDSPEKNASTKTELKVYFTASLCFQYQ